MTLPAAPDPSLTLTTVPGFRVGHSEVPGGGSGCTVVLGPFRGGVEVRGFATGTRELDVLSPHHLVEGVDAILLSGGSAFGLAAADGVMEWLKERGEGFDTGVAPVPLVPAAVLFDLAEGKPTPGALEGRGACEEASGAPVREGRVGAGAGATVGKILGPAAAAPGGVGSAARAWGEHWVGALAVVNALGDVVGADGSLLAGPRGEDGSLLDTDRILMKGRHPGGFADAAGSPREDGSGFPRAGTNTTLVVVGTDCPLSRTDLGRLSRMASGALPRAISPVNTPFDGDVVFGISSGEKAADLDPGSLLSLGVVSRSLVEDAIRRAVSSETDPPMIVEE